MAVLAEAIYFVEKNPDKSKAAVSRVQMCVQKAVEIINNSFAQHLEKCSFLKEVWDEKLPK
ncbi:MAG: hypothetical protein KGL31_00925 [candidate division NC10 bacterium]|nr:hypothetical protein [candidate division NC10 bacterium]MDE2320474.1 hypothetical protein [candidate division NC10 bacterium]